MRYVVYQATDTLGKKFFLVHENGSYVANGGYKVSFDHGSMVIPQSGEEVPVIRLGEIESGFGDYSFEEILSQFLKAHVDELYCHRCSCLRPWTQKLGGKICNECRVILKN